MPTKYFEHFPRVDYDIEKNKIGLELHKSIFSSSNKLEKFVDLDVSSINVEPGLLSDDNMNENLQSSIEFSHESGFDPFMESEFHDSLKKKNPDIVINLISSGLHKSSEKYLRISVLILLMLIIINILLLYAK